MFHHAAGGYALQGTLCGSLGACSAIINLVAKDKDNTHMKISGDLIAWYGQASFPTSRFDSIATYKDQIQVVPGSPLCHASASSWIMAAKTTYGAKERKDRCAKVAAEIAYHTVEALNAYAAGKYSPVAVKLSKDAEECQSCHGQKGADNVKTEMDCVSCHDDHTT